MTWPRLRMSSPIESAKSGAEPGQDYSRILRQVSTAFDFPSQPGSRICPQAAGSPRGNCQYACRVGKRKPRKIANLNQFSSARIHHGKFVKRLIERQQVFSGIRYCRLFAVEVQARPGAIPKRGEPKRSVG